MFLLACTLCTPGSYAPAVNLTRNYFIMHLFSCAPNVTSSFIWVHLWASSVDDCWWGLNVEINFYAYLYKMKNSSSTTIIIIVIMSWTDLVNLFSTQRTMMMVWVQEQLLASQCSFFSLISIYLSYNLGVIVLVLFSQFGLHVCVEIKGF